jgi:hypothetical protein
MELQTLISEYPKIYHMAEDGSWENIKKFGLLSTSALLDKWGIQGKVRKAIENEYRPSSITIHSIEFGSATIRDQKAMPPVQLQQCLPKTITVSEWYKYLNERVFFWSNFTGLKFMLSANNYIKKAHTVIAVDTEKLITDYGEKVFLSAINSGSTYCKKGKVTPEYRDFNTFKDIKNYSGYWLTELTINNGIPDITKYVIWAKRLKMNARNQEPEELGRYCCD